MLHHLINYPFSIFQFVSLTCVGRPNDSSKLQHLFWYCATTKALLVYQIKTLTLTAPILGSKCAASVTRTPVRCHIFGNSPVSLSWK